jgi:tagatose 1,6-diphosphate aldolase GatY/KbaY
MQSVITEKLTLFGSVGKAHLHETPYAEVLAGFGRYGRPPLTS